MILFLIAQGANRNKRLFLGGIVLLDAIWEKIEDTPNEVYSRKLGTVMSKSEMDVLNLDFIGSAYGDADRIPALYILHPEKNMVDKKLVQKLSKALTDKIKSMELNQMISLLKYKKQIILQGPPGTGKTRLAKELANELIKAEKALTPLEYLEWVIKNFQLTVEYQKLKNRREELLQEFYALFPSDQIDNLTLDSYCAGRGLKTTFCYWIEKKLTDFGRFSPGQAGNEVYLVYHKPDINNYKVKGGIDPEEMLGNVKEALSSLVTLTDVDKARSKFRDSLSLRVLSIYHPDKFFPVFSHNHLRVLARIFEISPEVKDDFKINQAINDKFKELTAAHNSPIDGIDLMWHIYNKFDIKNGEIEVGEVKVIESIGEKKLIQFHPAFTYEDFVRGIIAESNSEGRIEYKVCNKILADLAYQALLNPQIPYVLIIDEINRANLSAVLGELIYALEYRFDPKRSDQNFVESMYAIKHEFGDNEGDRKLRLPTNLLIIGTMNSADRSVGHIDYAIRRRFAFVDVLPTVEPIHDSLRSYFKDVSELFIKSYDSINWQSPQPLIPSDYLAPDFLPNCI